MDYFNIEDPNIFTIHKFMEKELDNSPHPKNYLIELTSNLAKYILNNTSSQQIQPYLQIKNKFFFFHPWLINFYGSTTSLIEYLCDYKLSHLGQSIEFALDPYKFKSEITSDHIQLEKITGIYYNIEKIIDKLILKNKPIISIFFDPELKDPALATGPDQKIKALERQP